MMYSGYKKVGKCLTIYWQLARMSKECMLGIDFFVLNKLFWINKAKNLKILTFRFFDWCKMFFIVKKSCTSS